MRVTGNHFLVLTVKNHLEIEKVWGNTRFVTLIDTNVKHVERDSAKTETLKITIKIRPLATYKHREKVQILEEHNDNSFSRMFLR